MDQLAVGVLGGLVGALRRRGLGLGPRALRPQADLVATPLGAASAVVVAVGAHGIAVDTHGMALVIVATLELALAVIIPFGGPNIHHA